MRRPPITFTFRRSVLTLASFAAVACAASLCARPGLGQTASTSKQTGAQARRLSDEEERLARDSKEAILGAGISEAYFDEHFALQRVYNSAADRRVVWRFRVGGHEAMLTDSVGFYTAEGGRRVYTHSVAHALPAAHDITKTITPQRARRLMQKCIGAYSGGAVVYGPGSEGRASLVFTAASKPILRGTRAEREREEREREARERREREERGRREASGGDVEQVREEDEGEGPTIFIGAVDLETGRCTKGLALAGPERPKTRERTRRRGRR